MNNTASKILQPRTITAQERAAYQAIALTVQEANSVVLRTQKPTQQ